jgi:hypothetical protein
MLPISQAVLLQRLGLVNNEFEGIWKETGVT